MDLFATAPELDGGHGIQSGTGLMRKLGLRPKHVKKKDADFQLYQFQDNKQLGKFLPSLPKVEECTTVTDKFPFCNEVHNNC